jgi:glutathionyl-hydroquinone reductase
VYQQLALAETVERDQIKGRYYARDEGANATGIVPKGPTIDSGSPTSVRAMHPT